MAAIVGIASGLVAVALGGLTFWTFFTDTSGSRMLNSAEGVHAALERIAESIEARPELLGQDDAGAMRLAQAAQAVNQSVETAAEARGLSITPASDIGQQLVIHRDNPLLVQTPQGQEFGMAMHKWSFTGMNSGDGALIINNKTHYALAEGTVVHFDVGQESCRAFMQDMRPDAGEIALLLRCG